MSWFRVFEPRPGAELRLVCFPHAGGSASAYRGWARLLPPSVELVAVQYPGRQDRFRDPVATSIVDLAGQIGAALAPSLGRPTVLFGHSMGAMVAYETSRLLVPRFPPPITRLVVSACGAPGVRGPQGIGFSDQELKDYVRAMGGAGLPEDEELWQVALPVLRNDLRLTESYRHVRGAPVTFPITAIAGADDAHAPPEEMATWGDHTIGAFESYVLPGGHFYLEDRLPELLALLLPATATTS